MRTMLMALAALAAVAVTQTQVARADDFSGPPADPASLNQQAVNAQAADPTASGSLRDHGQP